MAKYPPVTARHSKIDWRAMRHLRKRRQIMAAAAGASAALPVRPGEKPWTEAELTKVRQQLQQDIAGLTADISEAESAIAERLGDAVGDAGDDPADAGAKTFQREHELALTQNARELL